jgi:hypothetical protein
MVDHGFLWIPDMQLLADRLICVLASAMALSNEREACDVLEGLLSFFTET